MPALITFIKKAAGLLKKNLELGFRLMLCTIAQHESTSMLSVEEWMKKERNITYLFYNYGTQPRIFTVVDLVFEYWNVSKVD